MAAALSMTDRDARPLRPAAVNDRCASTVVNRSSAVSTVIPRGSRAWRNVATSASAACAAGPRPPERLRGSPTTTVRASTSPRTATTAAWSRARSPLRSTMPQGDASVRRLSL